MLAWLGPLVLWAGTIFVTFRILTVRSRRCGGFEFDCSFFPLVIAYYGVVASAVVVPVGTLVVALGLRGPADRRLHRVLHRLGGFSLFSLAVAVWVFIL